LAEPDAAGLGLPEAAGAALDAAGAAEVTAEALGGGGGGGGGVAGFGSGGVQIGPPLGPTAIGVAGGVGGSEPQAASATATMGKSSERSAVAMGRAARDRWLFIVPRSTRSCADDGSRAGQTASSGQVGLPNKPSGIRTGNVNPSSTPC
jgi:hypothetical protein